MFELQER